MECAILLCRMGLLSIFSIFFMGRDIVTTFYCLFIIESMKEKKNVLLLLQQSRYFLQKDKGMFTSGMLNHLWL